MPKSAPPSLSDLSIPQTARFLRLRRSLTKAGVNELFAKVLEQSDGGAIARNVRVILEFGDDRCVCSFLCFRMMTPVPFLKNSLLSETRYGFVLLIERREHLVVFHRGAKGLDEGVGKRSRPVDRRRLTHIHSDGARYQKLMTRRMTVAKQELRGASYEADDLEVTLVPATASRSILQSLRMATSKHGSVGVTPSTGRVRVSSARSNLGDLIGFIDETIDALETTAGSAFLNAFPEAIELDDLPADVIPSGVLIDLGSLYDRLDDPVRPSVLDPAADDLLRELSVILDLRQDDGEWDLVGENDAVIGHMKRLT